MKLTDRLLALPLLLLAGGVRLHRAAILGTQADEGVHVFVASQVADGLVVYRDLFENRTPLVEWLLALLFRVAGPDVFMARVLTVGAGLLAVAAAIAVVRLAGGGRRAGLLGATLFALAPLAVFWGRFALLEPFAVAFSLLSLAAGLRAWRGQHASWWVAGGALAALALLAKQTSVIYVAVFAVFLLLYARRGLGRWLVGFLPPLAGFAAILLAQGAWRPFWTFASGAERLTVAIDWANIAQMWLGWVRRQPLGLLLPFAVAITLFRRRPALFLLGAWAAAEWLALLLVPGLELGWMGFSHYLLPFLAAAAVFAGASLGVALQARCTRYLLVAGGLLALLALPGWWADLRYAAWETDYPETSRSAELAIGRALALLAPSGEPVLVLGNAVLYVTADRPAASRTFHYPGYLGDSALSGPAHAEIAAALGSEHTEAVAVSGFHLAERLPPELTSALWQAWSPVTKLSYPYQRDVFLWRRRVAPEPTGTLAQFGDAINLRHLDATQLGERTLLVTLVWEAEVIPPASYVAFVHVLDEDGNLIAQHDGIPVTGFRPTPSWQPGERVVDEHWIELPLPVTGLDRATVSTGLYRPEDVTRLDRSDGSGENSYSMPLESALR